MIQITIWIRECFDRILYHFSVVMPIARILCNQLPWQRSAFSKFFLLTFEMTLDYDPDSGNTGFRELTRGLATLPQRWIQEPLVVRDG